MTATQKRTLAVDRLIANLPEVSVLRNLTVSVIVRPARDLLERAQENTLRRNLSRATRQRALLAGSLTSRARRRFRPRC